LGRERGLATLAGMHGRGDGISVQTLIIASVASAAAALLTSFFWESGTVFSAALTPVLVTLLGEALKKPAATITQVRARRTSATRERTGAGAGRSEPVGPPSGPGAEPGLGREPAPRTSNGSGTYPPNGGRVAERPSRPTIYRRRRLNVRLAMVTGAVAFLIAGVALTVPELIAGQSLAGQGGRTTLGGGSSSDREEGGGDEPAVSDQPSAETPSEEPTRTETAPSASPREPTQTPDQASPPSGSTTTAPAPAPPAQARPKPPQAGASGAPRESAPPTEPAP
jgi:hypothetical protein